MLKRLGKSLPVSASNALRRRQNRKALSRLARVRCNADHLAKEGPELSTPADWEQNAWVAEIIEDAAGAVNRGDRRAIYTVARSLAPRRVLEIGTHLGGSTLMLALAIRDIPNAHLTTVDVADVNGPTGSADRHRFIRPIDALRRAKCEDHVTFVRRDSVSYLSECTERYDLIFLDGLHDADQVYREIPLALGLLNPGGLILLHDYFPSLQPLWKDKTVVPGPWMAVERLRSEDVPITVRPLGHLPWATKQDSNVTSLAYLLHS